MQAETACAKERMGGMQTQITKIINSTLLAIAVAVVGFVQPAHAGHGNSDNPGILPAKSQPHGKSYAEWVVAWWQWVMSIPADRNPLTDATGAFAGEGQSGPVWFLAGTFGNSVDRAYSIPQGKTLVVPVFNWIFGAGAFDCDPSVPGVPCDVPTLQASAAFNTEAATVIEVEIDGVAVKNVRDYRASSPGPFTINYPDNSVTGLPSGSYFPNVADGYWLILAPLSAGHHTIRLHVVAPATTYGPVEFVVIHHLTVE